MPFIHQHVEHFDLPFSTLSLPFSPSLVSFTLSMSKKLPVIFFVECIELSLRFDSILCNSTEGASLMAHKLYWRNEKNINSSRVFVILCFCHLSTARLSLFYNLRLSVNLWNIFSIAFWKKCGLWICTLLVLNMLLNRSLVCKKVIVRAGDWPVLDFASIEIVPSSLFCLILSQYTFARS